MSNSIGSIGDHPLDDLAAYALDALDDAERQAIDDHLARCEVCRLELAAHHETLAALAPDEAPPAMVWQRIADGIGAPDLPDPHRGEPGEPAEPPGVAAAPVSDGDSDGHAPTPITSLAEARAKRPSRLRWLAAAASLSAAAAAGGVFGFALRGASDGSEDIGGLAQQAPEQLATLADSGGRPVARVVADEDGAYIELEGLETLPEGQAYQLWSLTEERPVSLGMLGRDGTNTVAFRLPPTITELAISVAPTSGDVAPSGDFQASGSVARRS